MMEKLMKDFQLIQWRTWSGVLLIDLSMVWVLILLPQEMRAGLAPIVIGAQGALAVVLGTKSVLEKKVAADAAVNAKAPADAILAAQATKE
jgi:hypothetical protein